MARFFQFFVQYAILVILAVAAVAQGTAFLQDELPLKLQLVLPTELATSKAVTVSGQQAITAIFSRAVVALGSDFGDKSLPNDKVPFVLSGSVPGMAHWVTSYIYRFDPAIPWPTDLSIQLVWNKNLTTFDGIPFDLEGLTTVGLQSTPLTVDLQDVISTKAGELTDGAWSSVMTPGSDHEVPPDGQLQLYFNYNVSLSMLKDALQLTKDGEIMETMFNVSACPTPIWPAADVVRSSDDIEEAQCVSVSLDPAPEVATYYQLVLPAGTKYNKVSGPLKEQLSVSFTGLREFVIPFKKGDDATDLTFQRLHLVLPHGLAQGVSDSDLMKVITLDRLGSLASNGLAAEVDGGSDEVGGQSADGLPAASSSSFVGSADMTATRPVVTDAADLGSSVGVAGRRLQKVAPEFNSDETNSDPPGGTANTFDWSPWEVADVDPDADRMVFELKNVGKGIVSLSAKVQPSSVYRITVQATDSIKDGFGLPLKSSEGLFSMSAIGAVFAEPIFNAKYDMYGSAMDSLALMESGGDWTGSWGAVVRKGERTQYDSTPSKLSAWSVPLSTPEDIASFLPVLINGKAPGSNNVASDLELASLYGKPVAEITEATAANDVTGEVLGFDAASILMTGVLAKQTCCRPNYDGSSAQRPNSATFLQYTDVSVSIVSLNQLQQIVVWVTHLQNAAPMDAAEVTLWNVTQDAAAHVLGNQTTGRDGLVQFSWSGYDPAYTKAVLVVRYGDTLENVLPVGVVNTQVDKDNDIKGEIIVDRALLRPGEDLYVKGYLSMLKGDQVIVPTDELSNWDVFLVVANGFWGQADAKEVKIPIDMDLEFGTFNETIPVPSSAVPGDDYIRLLLAPKGSQSAEPALGTSSSTRGFAPVSPTASDGVEIAVATVTVADPRPPTVGMELQATDWAAPDESIPVKVKLESYIGTDVAGAQLDVSWVTQYNGIDTSGNPAEAVVTDNNGVAQFVIPAQDVNITADSWDSPTLQLTVQWIGPTRERLVETKTISLQDSPAKVVLYRSLITNVPGVNFYVAADAADINEEKLPGRDVDVKLYLNGTDGEELLKQCKVVTGAPYSSDCVLSIPNVGVHILEGCMDYNGTKGCTREFIGLDKDSWKTQPLTSFPELRAVAMRAGEKLLLQVDVPYDEAWGLITWGNGLNVRKRVLELENGLQTVELPLGDECLGGCQVQTVVTAPRQDSNFTVAANRLREMGHFTVSMGFDPAGPQTIYVASAAIEAPINITQDVAIKVSPGTTVNTATRSVNSTSFQPGDSVSISVSLPNAADRNATGLAQVTVVVVDKSILDLKPVTDPNLAAELAPNYPLEIQTSGTARRTITALDAVENVMTTAMSRLGFDPWLEPEYNDMNLLPPTGADIELGAYLETHFSYLTYGSSYSTYYNDGGAYYSDDMPEMASAAPVGTAGDAGRSTNNARASTASSSSAPRLTTEFQATPLFTTVTTAMDTAATVAFSAPAKLGTYVVRTFVRTSDGYFGQQSSELVVRTPVSLVPSVPRFARIGDSFDAGVLVTSVAATDEVNITITASVPSSNADAVQLQGSKSQTVIVQPNESKEVRFSFSADTLGSGEVLFNATSSQETSDALQVALDVQGVQDPVFVASSFALSAGDSSDSTTGSWTEGLQLPEAAPGSGTVNISAGVGRLPAVMTLADSVVKGTPQDPSDVAADWALAAIVAQAALNQYSLPSNDVDASGVTDTAARAVEELSSGQGTLTDDTLGLVWSKWFASNRYRSSPPDVRLNAWGKWLVDTSKKGMLADEAQNWGIIAASGITNEAQSARSRGEQYSDLDTLATVHLALGPSWQPQGTTEEIVQDLSMSRLVDGLANLTVYGKSAVVLSLIKQGGQDTTVDKVINLLLDDMRVRGRFSYIAAAPGTDAAAGVLDQSMALLAFVESKSDVPAVVEKLANFVASQLSNGGSSPAAFAPQSFSGAAASMLALTAYDQSRDNTNPDLEVFVTSGNTTLFQQSFANASSSAKQQSLPWSQLPDPAGSLSFAVKGTGEASIAVGLDFVPAELNANPIFRGLQVERVIQAINKTTNDAMGAPLQGTPLASQVRVTVRVTSPDTLGPVTVRVLMPGGLEPVDPNIMDDAQASMACPLLPMITDFGRVGSYSPFMPWPTCPQVLVWPSVVELRYISMTAGTHESSFLAVAATVGDWQLPPTKAFAALEPEVMGLSAAGNFTVCAECKQIEAQPEPVPKGCPGNCSGSGFCNTRRGVCDCLEGFSGEDCSIADGVEAYRQK